MPIREIVWTVAKDVRSITPNTPQDGGVQGEHNATLVAFAIPEGCALLEDKYQLYFTWVNATGCYDKSPVLEVENGRVAFLLPRQWTQYGGPNTLTLVAETNGETAYTLDARVVFHSRQTAAKQEKTLIAGFMQEMCDAAADAAAAAGRDANAATFSANAAAHSATRAGSFADSAAAGAKDAQDYAAAAETWTEAAEDAATDALASAKRAEEAAGQVKDGEDGIGVASAAIDGNGHLQITLTDGRVVDAGYAKGEQGKDGQRGPKGDKGDTGANGKDGAAGEQGDPGKDGRSAYDYAKDGGYTGTEEEFTAKLAQGVGVIVTNYGDGHVKISTVADEQAALSVALDRIIATQEELIGGAEG